MEFKVQYNTPEEREALISQNSHMFLLEEQNLVDGNFLIFGDKERVPEPIITKIEIDEEEFNKIKEENQQLQQSVLEMTTYSASQDERLATQEQALLELTTLVAGGNA